MTDPLARAYATCHRIARVHYENFPVASRLLPFTMRSHVAAIYAFARYADDYADEGECPDAERLSLLDHWLGRLHRVEETTEGSGNERDDIFLAVGHTIETYRLPVVLFEDLLSAFRQDVTVHRYESWEQLLDYCRRSANPVGRLILRIAGYQTDMLERLDSASDCVCTALQITNFLQDFELDWSRDRLYVPAQIHQVCGAHLSQLGRSPLPQPWRDALAEMATRTRTLFDEGRAVCDGVRGCLQLELRMTWLGGMRILDRLAQTEYDPLTNRPTLSIADAPPILWQALRWNRSAP